MPRKGKDRKSRPKKFFVLIIKLICLPERTDLSISLLWKDVRTSYEHEPLDSRSKAQISASAKELSGTFLFTTYMFCFAAVVASDDLFVPILRTGQDYRRRKTKRPLLLVHPILERWRCLVWEMTLILQLTEG